MNVPGGRTLRGGGTKKNSRADGDTGVFMVKSNRRYFWTETDTAGLTHGPETILQKYVPVGSDERSKVTS